MVAIIELVPLWLLLFLTLAFVIGFAELGHRLGARRRKLNECEKTEPVNAMAGTLLGLLAFLLAFVFGVSATRYSARQDLVLREANAIGTCYMRADLLPEPRREPARELLREYVDVRLAWAASESAGEARHSQQIHAKLWKFAVEYGRVNSGSDSAALFIDSLNEVIEVHEERVLARSHINAVIWISLYVLTALAFATMGYYTGLHASVRSPVLVVTALAFAIVIVLIADLDRPMDGLVTTSQHAMLDLKESMQRDR